MDREIREHEDESLAKDRDAEGWEKQIHCVSRTALQETNDGVEHKRRKRNHEGHKTQSEGSGAKGLYPVAEKKAPPADHYKGKYGRR